jgi:endonuclease/exonuclease/phosphatase family metal-dependent hydrolase
LRARAFELSLLALAAACALYGFGPPRSVFGYEPPSRPGNVLRIVTWNIGRADGPRLSLQGPGASDLQQVRDTLIELDADVLILQEARSDVTDAIARDFPGAQTAFAGSRDGGCAVVVQGGRLVQLPVMDWSGREPVHIVFRQHNGRSLQVIGMHADSWSASERNRQIGRAVELLEDTLALPLHVLAGDLNLDVDLGGGKDLFTEDEYLDVQTYNFVAERMHDAGATSGPTAEPDRRLDYVFIQTEDGQTRVRDAGVWRGRRVGGMDHHPVVVDLPAD